MFLLFFSSIAKSDLEFALDDLKQKMLGKSYIRAEFTQQRNIALLSRPFISTGFFFYHRQQGLCWDVQMPYPITIVVRQDRIVQQSKNRPEQVIRFEQNPLFETVATIFFAVFNGDWSAVEDRFQLAISGDPAAWTILLTPTDTLFRKVYTHIEIQGADWIRQVNLVEPGGDNTLIEFKAPVFVPATAEADGTCGF